MKRIVYGVTYNTDTSTALAQSKSGDQNQAEGVIVGTLYQTRGNAFFVHQERIRRVWNMREERHEERTDDTFLPLSADDAQRWIITGDVEVFHNPFEDPPEAVAEPEQSTTLYIRVPSSLKRRVDEAARDDLLSGNVWAMRCLERCLVRGDIKRFPELAHIYWLASRFQSVPAEWEQEEMLAALEDITGRSKKLAKRLGVSLDGVGQDFDYDTICISAAYRR